MAVRKVVITFGQSNSGPFHDLESWLPDRVDMNLLLASNKVSGSLDTSFQMPFNAPGFSALRPIQGLAVRPIRYLTFYNPVATGYTSYPGTGRVLGMADMSGFAHSTTAVWVEQMFVRGTHQVTSVTRKTTGVAHPVLAVMEPVMAFTTNFAVSTSHLLLTNHGFLTNDRATLTTTASDLPNGLLTATSYWVTVVDANTFTLSLTSGGPAVTFSDNGTGTHSVNVSKPANAGCRLQFAAGDAWGSPVPQFEEEFSYAVKATAASSGVATATLNINFGIRRQTTASLKGLQLRHATQGNRVIDTWDPVTRTATLVNPVGLAPQVWTIAAGDELVIEPQSGIPWERYCFFLPWTMFEGDLSVPFIDKRNPYLPGFDYPNDFHAPQLYGTDLQTPVAIPGTSGLFVRTMWPWIAWHPGMLVRLSEFYGEEVWCISTDFGGTSASHDETTIGTDTIGWYDKGQQTDWSLGRPNGCFARWLVELDAAIASAAAVGDTLKVVGVWRNQGFADGTSESDPTYGASAAQSGIGADKFYDTNRAFRARVRAEIKARGLWDGDASEIPFVQPLEQEESALLAEIGDATLLQKVNYAIQRLSDEDDYAETWDQTGLLTGPDGIHFLGSELARIEQANMDAFVRILRRTDRTGEVAICNAALALIGEESGVTSLNPSEDASAEAARCAQFYPKALRWALEERNWSFAMQRRSLARTTHDSSVWLFCYLMPSDCVRPVSVIPSNAADDNVQAGSWPGSHWPRVLPEWDEYAPSVVPQQFSHERKPNGTSVIYTNLEDAHLRYVGMVRDTSAYTEKFREAVQFKLASYLAGATMKGRRGIEVGQAMQQGAMLAIGGAADLDGVNHRTTPKHVPKWFAT